MKHTRKKNKFSDVSIYDTMYNIFFCSRVILVNRGAIPSEFVFHAIDLPTQMLHILGTYR